MEVSKLPEYEGSLTVHLDGKDISVPKLASVNGKLQSAYYQIQDGDQVELLNYYTVLQILEFMDISSDQIGQVMVNHEIVDLSAKVYDNFTVSLQIDENGQALRTGEAGAFAEEGKETTDTVETEKIETEEIETQEVETGASQEVPSALEKAKADADKLVTQLKYERAEEALAQMIRSAMNPVQDPASGNEPEEQIRIDKSSKELYGSLQDNINRLKKGTPITDLRKEAIEKEQKPDTTVQTEKMNADVNEKKEEVSEPSTETTLTVPPMSTENVNGKLLQILHVIVNDELVTLKGKPDYIYVDVFEFIQFDLSRPQGKSVETLINGRKAQYTEPLSNGDRLEIFWKD